MTKERVNAVKINFNESLNASSIIFLSVLLVSNIYWTLFLKILTYCELNGWSKFFK